VLFSPENCHLDNNIDRLIKFSKAQWQAKIGGALGFDHDF
jgi:hypothetical protein